jgi:uncharacterized membrane protein YkoI
MHQIGVRHALLDRRRNLMQNGPKMMNKCALLTLLAALLAALALAAPAAHAETSSSSSSSSASSSNGRTTTRNSSSDSNRNSDHRDDQDDAREALRRGRVMPLTAILEIAFKRERGTVLDVDLETEDRILVYEIELLSESGRKVEMRINARSGEILKVRYP